MRRNFGPKRARRLLLLAALTIGLTVVAVGCSGDDDEAAAPPPPAEPAPAEPAPAEPAPTEPAPTEPAPTEPPATGGTIIQQPGQCGSPDAQGQPATGEPIKLGAIVTNVPGVDFTWITNLAKAYFDCVNDNGGIGGRPIEYIIEEEQVDPQQIASLATKLVEQDQVLGLAGSTSLIECAVNRDYYAAQNLYTIIAGVSQDCFTSPNFSAVNMGPYYSSLGGAQAALRAGATGKIVMASVNAPGFDVVNSGVVEYAEQNGLEAVSILEDVPIADPAGFAQRMVTEAGEGGGVVFAYTGPTVLPVLEAIEQQGLIDSVVWASATPPNDPSVAEALGPEWNDKFLINAEFNVLDSGDPDAEHMLAIIDQYAPGAPIASFSQMGYLVGRVATDALLGIEGELTRESVNAAFKAIVNFPSDLWCKPWYYDSTVGANVSNNVDITVVPRDGVMVQTEDCFDISDLGGTVPVNALQQIRAAEAELGLNAG